MNIMKLSMSVLVSAAAILISSTAIAAEPALQAAVERGATPAATTSDARVVRIGWQRTDVPVRVDGVPLPGGCGLRRKAKCGCRSEGPRVGRHGGSTCQNPGAPEIEKKQQEHN